MYEDTKKNSEKIEYRGILGKGNFSLVQRVIYRGQEIALKTVFEFQSFDAERKVAQFLKPLSLPNVITFYPECADLSGIGMAYMRGGSLSQLLARGSIWDDLDLFERYRLAACICNGVRMLHRHGVLHGDIKPANILLDENLQPSLADFGDSVRVDGDELVKHASGSTGFIAPEVLLYSLYSKKADVYSLGTTLWQLFFRKMPFEKYWRGHYGYSIYKNSINTATIKGESPGHVTDVFGAMFRELIEGCWHKDPSQRPSAESCYWQLSVLVLFSMDPSLKSEKCIHTAEDEAALRRRLIEMAPNWIENATDPLRLIDRVEYLFSQEISDPAYTTKKSGNVFFQCTWRGKAVSPALSAMAEAAKKKVLSLYTANPNHFCPDEKAIIRHFLSIPRSKGLFGGTLFQARTRGAKQFDACLVEIDESDRSYSSSDKNRCVF